jgi:hypothetical protein
VGVPDVRETQPVGLLCMSISRGQWKVMDP